MRIEVVKKQKIKLSRKSSLFMCLVLLRSLLRLGHGGMQAHFFFTRRTSISENRLHYVSGYTFALYLFRVFLDTQLDL